MDDFLILHNSRKQLSVWQKQIDEFLKEKLEINLHPQKSKIISIYKGMDFVGFRIFCYHKLLRARNIKGMTRKIEHFKKGVIDFRDLFESYQGWQAYARWANSHKLRKNMKNKIVNILWDKIE